MTSIVSTPKPPYYAVIFTSLRRDEDQAYSEAAALMLQLASEQPGFLGMESARSGLGLTVSYWADEASIRAWKQQVDHAVVQRLGREQWYDAYGVRVAKVERQYFFERARDGAGPGEG